MILQISADEPRIVERKLRIVERKLLSKIMQIFDFTHERIIYRRDLIMILHNSADAKELIRNEPLQNSRTKIIVKNYANIRQHTCKN